MPLKMEADGRSWRRKLTPEQVLDMRRRYARQQPLVSLPELAREFGVAYSTVHAVVNYVYYRELA